jgi:hypothetical protein
MVSPSIKPSSCQSSQRVRTGEWRPHTVPNWSAPMARVHACYPLTLSSPKSSLGWATATHCCQLNPSGNGRLSEAGTLMVGSGGWGYDRAGPAHDTGAARRVPESAQCPSDLQMERHWHRAAASKWDATVASVAARSMNGLRRGGMRYRADGDNSWASTSVLMVSGVRSIRCPTVESGRVTFAGRSTPSGC